MHLMQNGKIEGYMEGSGGAAMKFPNLRHQE